jgi:hypothetical protein
MNTISSYLLAAALLAPLTVTAASFEGTVNFKMTPARGQPQQITYNIKGDRMRIEMPGQDAMGGMIVDSTKRESIVIMEQEKMYMTMAMPAPEPDAGRKGGEVSFERTGEKETILGYSAEKYLSTDRDTKTELWLADGLGAFMMPGNNPMGGGRGRGKGAAPQGWERALAGRDLFPLRVVTFEKNGRESFRMEATALEKKSLPDSLFEPPAGYQKFDMGGMMKGMMKGLIPGRP